MTPRTSYETFKYVQDKLCVHRSSLLPQKKQVRLYHLSKTLKELKQPPEVFCKKGVLRNFAKFTGKHLCQSLFFNQVAGLRPGAGVFLFCEIPENTFFTEHLRTTASETNSMMDFIFRKINPCFDFC